MSEKIHKYLNAISYCILLFTIAAIPLSVTSAVSNTFVLPKQLALGIPLCGILVLFLTQSILEKKIIWRSSFLDLPLLVVLVSALLSAVFSIHPHDSLYGRIDYFTLNTASLLMWAFFYWSCTQLLSTPRRWQGAIGVVIATGGTTALLFILKTLFQIDPLAALGLTVWNTLEGVNSTFGLWTASIFVLCAGLVAKKNLSFISSLFNCVVLSASLIVLILLSFKILWWIVLAGLLLLLCLGVSFMHEVRLWWLSVLFALVVLVGIFILVDTPRSLQTILPVEAVLNPRTSLIITEDTVLSSAKNFLLGSGLGSFGFDFAQFRPEQLNNDQLVWSLRFNQPFNVFFGIAAEGGVLLFGSVLFIIFQILHRITRCWFHYRKEGIVHVFLSAVHPGSTSNGWNVLVISLVWVVLSTGAGILFFGPVLWWWWFFLSGLSVVGLSFFKTDSTVLKEFSFNQKKPEHVLLFSFGGILLLTTIAVAAIWQIENYLAETKYTRALRSTDFTTARDLLAEALTHRPTQDIYAIALAQVSLGQAVQLANTQKTPANEVKLLVEQALAAARHAAEISPYNNMVWENVAIIYDTTALFVEDARTLAINALLSAQKINPSNPVLSWRLGNEYVLVKKMNDAEHAYKESIRLKKDYVNGYLGLTHLYEEQNNLDKAVDIYQVLLTLSENNSNEIWFNYGRLLFNRNSGTDRADAEKIWKALVDREPRYANALYSLGLLAEAKGDKMEALRYYYKVKDLNPSNQEVLKKIKGLLSSEPTSK